MRALRDTAEVCRSALKKYPHADVIKTLLGYTEGDREIIDASLKRQRIGIKAREKQLNAGAVRMRMYPWTRKSFPSETRI
jgi:hypothetical protein